MSYQIKPLDVETLRWRENHLELIDQRLLPNQIEYPSYHRAADVARAIRDMVVRGAPAIGCTAAYGIALEARYLAEHSPDQFWKGIDKAFEVLERSRPTAVNLFWALKRMRKSLDKHHEADSLGALAIKLLDEAHLMTRDDIAVNRSMGHFGASLIPDGARILTHCNAGALATAGHGTALGVIRSAVEQGKQLSVYADETRPYLQGARLTAWELMQSKIPVTLISDNMSGHLMQLGEIDAVIVGTDRVAANGDVANKIGTYMVAVLASRHKIPFYVACPISTIDMETPTGSDIPIEERSPDEVIGYRDLNWAPKGVSVRNPSFDVTPAELVTALITEKGVVKYPNHRSLNAIVSNY